MLLDPPRPSDPVEQGCPIFATEGRVYAGFHSNQSLHLLISLISSLFSG